MQRYDLDEYGGKPYPHEDGDWVKWEDVRNLVIAHEKLKLALQLIVDAGEGK